MVIETGPARYSSRREEGIMFPIEFWRKMVDTYTELRQGLNALEMRIIRDQNPVLRLRLNGMGC